MPVNILELTQFLQTINQLRFVKKQLKPIELENGGKEISYTIGDYTYTDQWHGGWPRSSTVTVAYQGKVIWSMTGRGNLFSHDNPKNFEHFLFNTYVKGGNCDLPVCGPDYEQDNNYAYSASSHGSMVVFEIFENGFYKGDVIYKSHWQGGLVNQ